MKKVLLLVCLVFAKQYVYSQNVGVGTVSPAYKLDVKGDINTDSVYRIRNSVILSTKGQFNIFVGENCGTAITTGLNNTGLGARSLMHNADGYLNTAIGASTLHLNTQGNYNTALGADALYSNTTGTSNTASGYLAMVSNTTGIMNVATGDAALSANTTGSRNSAFGSSALSGNTASDNTAVGFYALRDNSTGGFNTAIGASSLLANDNGALNTATGYTALFANTTGDDNTANGAQALRSNTTGFGNSAFGTFSLSQNVLGLNNTAVGFSASFRNTNGNFNTAVGAATLQSTIAASYNTALGYNAGISYELGWNNTIIGAEANLSFNGQYNSIAIGNLAVCPDNSTVRIGNSANWSYGAYANWTNISDERYKINVKENVAGLDFILRLRPVTYQMNVTALSKKLNEGNGKELNETMKLAIAEKEKIVWTGFMAQEVETAANATGFDFSGVDKPSNEHGVYGLRYAEFVVPLVKAVQELSLQNEQLKKENKELLKRIQRIESILDQKAFQSIPEK